MYGFTCKIPSGTPLPKAKLSTPIPSKYLKGHHEESTQLKKIKSNIMYKMLLAGRPQLHSIPRQQRGGSLGQNSCKKALCWKTPAVIHPQTASGVHS